VRDGQETSRGHPSGCVYLSSTRDRAFVERIVAALRRHGIPCWYAPTGILGAQQWQDEIGRALRRCNWFLVVLSRSASRSKWVKRELQYALQDDRYNDRILAIVKAPGDYSTCPGHYPRSNKSISPAISTVPAPACSGSGASSTSLIDRELRGGSPRGPGSSVRGGEGGDEEYGSVGSSRFHVANSSHCRADAR
jgi:hypothetical protein